MTADPEQVFVWETGQRPTIATKLNYWRHEVFAAREACAAEDALAAANDNPFPPMPVPRSIKIALAALLLLVPLGGWGGWRLLSTAAPPVVAAVQQASDAVGRASTGFAFPFVAPAPEKPGLWQRQPMPTPQKF